MGKPDEPPHAGETAGDFGKTLRDWRERLGLRQGDLAKKSGMSSAQLCHIEKSRNMPSVRTLQRIADALGVPFARLAAGATEALDEFRGESVPLVEESFAAHPRHHLPRLQAMVHHFLAPRDAAIPGNRWLAGVDASLAEDPVPTSRAYPMEAARARREGSDPAFPRPVGTVSLATLPAEASAQVRSRIAEYRDLERRARVPVQPSLSLDYPAEIRAGDAEALAGAVRRAAGIADAVIFDSIALLENKGIRVVAADLPEGVDAFALWDAPVRNLWLMVRKAAPDERQQLRALSEFATALQFVANGANEPVQDTPRNRRFAQDFAEAFLMPAAALRELCYRFGLGDGDWTWELLLREKHRYGVPAESFARRLESLGLLRPSLRQELVRRLRAWRDVHGGGEPEPSHRKDIRHSRFGDLKLLAGG